MNYSSDIWVDHNWHHCKSLLSLSVEAVADGLQYHLGSVQTLPKHLKSWLLSLATKRGSLSNAALSGLVHVDVTELNLCEIPVCDKTLDVISVCHQLHKLDINPGRNQRRNISTAALMRLFPSFPHLSILYIRKCEAVSDDVIYVLVHCCPLLKELDVGGCSMITDNALKEIKDLEHLMSLNLSSSKISDHGILMLVEGKCGSSLTELRLDSCQGITDYGIENIVLYCSSMKVLIFHGCPVTGVSQLALENLLLKSNVKQLTWTVR